MSPALPLVSQARGASTQGAVAAGARQAEKLADSAREKGKKPGYTPAEAAGAVAADDGEQGTAVVLAAEDRPGRRLLNPPGGTVDLLLEVARPGGDRYTTHLVVGFSTPERRARVATVGNRLPVRVHPDKPGKIAIDTTALFGQG